MKTRKNSKLNSGIYNLIIFLPSSREINIGKKRLFFPEGYYVYTGSAHQNLQSRIKRHLSSNKKFHWHIDYLLEFAKIEEVRIHLFKHPLSPLKDENFGKIKKECLINQKVKNLKGAKIIHRGFGSSDCQHGCLSHLIYFGKNYPKIKFKNFL